MVNFQRETKENKPVIALCYDFDKTLSPNDMQAQGFIQSVGYDIADFWKKSNGRATDNDMDLNLAYMLTMQEEAEGKFVFTKEKLEEYGSKVDLFSGVEDWFDRVNAYGQTKGVIVEHYIISSGLKEMIEGTSIAKNGAFKKIYATSFYCNDKGTAVWPAQVVNYTNKTQFLFRISKGVLDINDQGVNDAFNPEDIRVPFRNMIYIGDSDTDIPCMKLVNSHGGYSIGVFDPDKNDRSKVYKMTVDNRIKYFDPADYTDNGELDQLIKLIIDKTVYNEKLETKVNKYKKEASAQYNSISNEEQEKQALISDLESSRSFSNTHQIIKGLNRFMSWSTEQINKLVYIARKNSQVSTILTDGDVKRFYTKIIEQSSQDTDDILWIKRELRD